MAIALNIDRVRSTTLAADQSLRRDALFWTLRPLALAILAIGLLVRLSPLFDLQGRLFWQFMTEDGYLMQTIARNMAIGLGMTTADGTIETNGVQPLATFLFAGLHWLAGGDRVASIALVTVISAVVAAISTYFLYRLGRVLLRDMKSGEAFALIVAAIWFASPLPIAHSMNGLETGLYILMMLASLTYLLTHFAAEAGHVRTRHAMVLGILLGLTFLARNDAVFFIAALLLVHLLTGARDLPSFRRRLVECLLAGTISIVIALPWLINNYVLFGTIVPISGISQSYNAALGANLPRVPAILFESAVPLLPIPQRFEHRTVIVVLTTIFLLGVLLAYWFLHARHRRENRMFAVISLLFGSALVAYYGLFFGAPHFLARYMSVLSSLLWSMTAAVGFSILSAALLHARRITLSVAALLGIVLVGASAHAVLTYRHGTGHMHKQVVEWVAANATEDQWVGAVQTGTLGYFHDRTLNLDGKVNPAALRELLDHGHVLDYVIGTPVAFIVDWAGVANWADYPKAGNFNRHFELAVRNDAENLSVFKRKITQSYRK